MNVAQNPSKKSGRFWMFLPVGLLLTSTLGWLLMVRVAIDDPGFAVEADYYKKASHHDDVMAQRKLNSQLQWQVRVESFELIAPSRARLRVRVVDASGQAIDGAQVSADVFANARAGDVQSVSFAAQAGGIYEAEVERPRLGIWELRLEVTRGTLFTQTLRMELFPGVNGAGPS